MTINIITHGRGSPLVLFHGWGFDSQVWHSLLPDLQSRHELYLVDLPGFGLSPQMDWEAFKSNLLPQLPERFALLGWSMGGLFATRLAIEEPARVSHLLNVASSPRFVKDDLWPGVDLQKLKIFYDELIHDPEKTRAEFIRLQLQGQVFPISFTSPAPGFPALRAGLELLLNWDFRQALLQYNQPVCYLFGRLDAIISREVMPVMQKNYPDFDYVLFKKAAHMPFLSHSKQFIDELERFIQ